MARTWKDLKAAKDRNAWSVRIPSSWNRAQRRRVRNLAKQDLRNGREPQPRYGDEYYW